MRRPITRLVLIASLLATGSLTLEAEHSPRLVVMLVVDSLRAESIAALSSHWRNGFRTLLAEGATFRQVQIPYLQTDTCSGHASLSTGVSPRRHGMVGDNWRNAALRKDIECTEDSVTKPVTYGRPARIGNSAKWLMASTLSDRIREQRRGGRIVTLSLKARAAIGLAGHAADAVTWFEDGAGAFVTSTAYASAPVPILKRAIQASPYERALDTTWTLRDGPATYRQRDAGIGERPPAGWTGLFPHTLKGKKGPTTALPVYGDGAQWPTRISGLSPGRWSMHTSSDRMNRQTISASVFRRLTTLPTPLAQTVSKPKMRRCGSTTWLAP